MIGATVKITIHDSEGKAFSVLGTVQWLAASALPSFTPGGSARWEALVALPCEDGVMRAVVVDLCNNVEVVMLPGDQQSDQLALNELLEKHAKLERDNRALDEENARLTAELKKLAKAAKKADGGAQGSAS